MEVHPWWKKKSSIDNGGGPACVWVNLKIVKSKNNNKKLSKSHAVLLTLVVKQVLCACARVCV